MSKQKQVFIAGGLLLVAIIGAGFYVSSRTSATSPTPTTHAKAKATPVAAKCLEESASLTLPTGSRDDIELSAISYLIDVPAGTNVDVKIASYDTNKITGSDRYPAKYGSYNFVMEKQGGNWAVTDFKQCE
jgi:hypothetical protein